MHQTVDYLLCPQKPALESEYAILQSPHSYISSVFIQHYLLCIVKTWHLCITKDKQFPSRRGLCSKNSLRTAMITLTVAASSNHVGVGGLGLIFHLIFF